MSWEERDRWISLTAARGRGESLNAEDTDFVEAYEASNPEASNERALWASFGAMPTAVASAGTASTSSAEAVSLAAKDAVASYHKTILAKWVFGVGLALGGAGAVVAVTTAGAEPEEQLEVVRKADPVPVPVPDDTAAVVKEASTEGPLTAPPAVAPTSPELEKRTERSTRASSAPRKPPEPAAPSADEMLEAAQAALARGARSKAILSYQELINVHPGSAAGTAAHLTLAELLRVDGDHALALQLYEGYLERGGKLRAQAKRGRIGSLRALDRSDDERTAIEAYLDEHGEERDAESLRVRLRVLAGD